MDPTMNWHDQDINPYAPPAVAKPYASIGIVSNVNIVARCPRRRWASRTLLLNGDLEAELTYLTWTPGESVLLNGKKIAKARGHYIAAVCPRIEFALPIGDRVIPTVIFAKASYLQLLRILDFRLVIADQVVYDDRE